jgi:hypothetical protein
MKFDHDILFEFLPEEDKKSFMAWDNVFCNPTGRDAKAAGVVRIVAVYRAPFEERVFISLSDYELKLKQKLRDNKLDTILCNI